MLHIKVHTAFGQILSSSHRMFQFVLRENAVDKEEEGKKTGRSWRGAGVWNRTGGGGREENLVWSFLIRSRPVLSTVDPLHRMTSLWRKTVSEREEAFFPLLEFAFFSLSFPSPLWTISSSLNAAKASWARKFSQRHTSHHMCILNPPRRRGTESYELMGVHHL